MTQHHEAIKEAIKKALQSLATGDLPKASTKLFGILGYRSERVLEGQRGNVGDFIGQFPAPKQETESEESFRKSTTAVHILFQVTDEEIADSDQGALFDAKQFDKGLNKSYLFLVVQLKESSYSRTHYAGFTREINKRFPMPAFVLFRTGQGQQSKVTLAFIQRRKHKRDEQRHVLGSVSLIRDIDPHDPHRAHLDILAELPLPKQMEWMASHKKPANFDGLLAALLNTLDTQELNKRFYEDLFGWFKRAIEVVKVPTDQAKSIPKQEHIIRLITRLLFVWFIKEKGLVAGDLFIEKWVCSLLKNYDRERGDSYYRAVLQNLFFATLNTEIHKRGFSTTTKCTHRDFSRYRYKDEMADPESLLKLFEKTPFINGGLFDCLDSFESTGAGGYRIDCFSDNLDHRKLLSIPNHLFFADDGLVTIFNRYKFTVEENTPIEQDVALDPELLGKVFENLLAAVNPETRETARKQTGSYYTPRLVVDYMVEEALVASLTSKVQPVDGDAKFLRDRLHYLLDYEDAFDDAKDLFEDGEAQQIVQAIAEIKVLDPAVGSGAFPMGILHKLTLALQRLDPHNTRWQALQKHMAQTRAAAAFDTSDPQNRGAELHDISTTFQRYKGSDFGRKLYLIQNSIFGVDIQTIACQIAKLRFFISLAIEQQPNDNPRENYGIKPLPNLETRFVAANTLLALDRRERLAQLEIGETDGVQQLQRRIRLNREGYFHARTRQQKKQHQNEDKRLRQELVKALQPASLPVETAKQIAAWDPYDQNASTDWFDAGYMFGVGNGFDVVIGNPPYVKVEYIDDIVRQQIRRNFQWLGDLYEHFIFKGYELVRNKGILSYITNDSWISLSQKIRIRDLILENRMLSLIKAPAQTFTASIYAAVFVLSKETPSISHAYSRGEFSAEENFQFKNFGNVEYSTVHNMPDRKFLLSSENTLLIGLMSYRKVKDFCCILDTGIHSGNVRSKIFFNEDNGTRSRLLQGKQIQKYFIYWNNPSAKYRFCDIEYQPLPQPGIGRGGRPSSRNEYWNFCGDIENHHQPERLLMRQTEDDLVVTYHNQSEHGLFYTDNTLFTILPKSESAVNLKYLLALFNSKLLNFLYHSMSQEKGKSQAQVKVKTVRELPAALPDEDELNAIVLIIEEILEAKATNPAADTSALEAEIDRLVYQLYGLTEEEIATVEGSSTTPEGMP